MHGLQGGHRQHSEAEYECEDELSDAKRRPSEAWARSQRERSASDAHEGEPSKDSGEKLSTNVETSISAAIASVSGKNSQSYSRVEMPSRYVSQGIDGHNQCSSDTEHGGVVVGPLQNVQPDSQHKEIGSDELTERLHVHVFNLVQLFAVTTRLSLRCLFGSFLLSCKRPDKAEHQRCGTAPEELHHHVHPAPPQREVRDIDAQCHSRVQCTARNPPSRVATGNDHESDGKPIELIRLLAAVVASSACNVEHNEAQQKSVQELHNSHLSPAESRLGVQRKRPAKNTVVRQATQNTCNQLHRGVRQECQPPLLIALRQRLHASNAGDRKRHCGVEMSSTDIPQIVDHHHQYSRDGDSSKNSIPAQNIASDCKHQQVGAEKLGGTPLTKSLRVHTLRPRF
mmetsp:Transcript_33720/g.81640  ORF Transcript_33720/g.81640 Transcript_33720/m.81640 type:complete len:398 (-) Transcript_33720:48-1241(-)